MIPLPQNILSALERFRRSRSTLQVSEASDVSSLSLRMARTGLQQAAQALSEVVDSYDRLNPSSTVLEPPSPSLSGFGSQLSLWPSEIANG